MRVSHETVYADYQATTPVDPRVLEAMAPFWSETFGNPHSGDHVMGWHGAEAVENAATAVGALIGADGAEITFTSGATEANNLALLGLARRAPYGRDRILVGATEHKSVLAAAQAAADHEGLSVETIPVDGTGALRLDALRGMLDEHVLVVSVMAVNNEVGTVQNIPAIASLMSPLGVLLHCDAAQAPCAVDMGKLASIVDLLSLSGHKMYGPKGIGALYARHGMHDRIEPLIYGGGQQGGLRSGTVPVPLCVGMGVAVDIMRSDGEAERGRVGRLRDAFVDRVIESVPGVVLNGPASAQRHPGNANVRIDGLHAQDALAAMQPGLAAATGAACASGITEPSHVLVAMGFSEAEATSSARFSFGRFTTEQDIQDAVRLLEATVVHLRSGL